MLCHWILSKALSWIACSSSQAGTASVSIALDADHWQDLLLKCQMAPKWVHSDLKGFRCTPLLSKEMPINLPSTCPHIQNMIVANRNWHIRPINVRLWITPIVAVDWVTPHLVSPLVSPGRIQTDLGTLGLGTLGHLRRDQETPPASRSVRNCFDPDD